MLLPNSGRVVIELLRTGEKEGEIFLPTRENLKVGENLLIGRIIHAGDSEFTLGQLVLFQDYSLSGVYKDVAALAKGGITMAEAQKPENQHHIIATADIMGSVKE